MKFVLDHIFDVIGCKYKITDQKSAANVIYGSENDDKNILFLHHDKNLWDLEKINVEFSNYEYNLNDCLYKCHYSLNRLWEKHSKKDIYGVVSIADQDDLSFVKNSFVAEFITILKKDLLKLFKTPVIPLWPNNADFCLVMSHDVDEPYKYYKSNYYYDELKWKVRNKKNVLSLAKTSLKIGKSFINNFREDKNFGFEYWHDIEKKIGGKSAFYVSVINSYNSPYGHHCDVPYNYDDDKIKKNLNLLLEDGWEIGLHASMNSYLKLDRLAEEKFKLESILGEKIKGVRHHYWRLGDDINNTHKNHFKVGFEYDSSLGLNDAIGFRSGTMWPYLLLEDEEGKKSFYQIPPTIMDGNIFYYDNSYENYYYKIRSHFEYVEKMNGCVVLDWHLEQSDLNRLNKAGFILRDYLINELTKKNVFITSPIGLLDWWKERRELINSNK